MKTLLLLLTISGVCLADTATGGNLFGGSPLGDLYSNMWGVGYSDGYTVWTPPSETGPVAPVVIDNYVPPVPDNPGTVTPEPGYLWVVGGALLVCGLWRKRGAMPESA